MKSKKLGYLGKGIRICKKINYGSNFFIIKHFYEYNPRIYGFFSRVKPYEKNQLI